MLNLRKNDEMIFLKTKILKISKYQVNLIYWINYSSFNFC